MTVVIGILTVVIAFIAVYVACQQAKTRKAQYRLNLYDKRFAVFKATRCFLGDIAKYAKIVDASDKMFWLSVVEAEFLFKNDVVTFLKELGKKSTALISIQTQLHGQDRLTPGDERNLASKENSELIGWFIEQGKGLGKRFEPYLKCE